MASGGGDRRDGWSTGQKVATGLGILGAAVAAYAAYQAYNDEEEKPKLQGESSRRNDVSYKKNQCVMCDLNIIDNAKKLSCDHAIHADCLRTLIGNGGSKCPMCFKQLTSEDLYNINKGAINNRANQLNRNHLPSGPGRPARYPGTGDKADLDNHSNQLNPNKENYQGGQRNRRLQYQF